MNKERLILLTVLEVQEHGTGIWSVLRSVIEMDSNGGMHIGTSK